MCLVNRVRGYCLEVHPDSVCQLLSTRNDQFVTIKLRRAIMVKSKPECKNLKNLSEEKAPG